MDHLLQRQLATMVFVFAFGTLCVAPMTLGADQPELQSAKTKVTLDLYGVDLGDCLALLAEQASVDILVEPGLDRVVSVHVVNQAWDDVLWTIVEGNDLVMIQNGESIVIRGRQSPFFKRPDAVAPELSYQGEPVHHYVAGMFGEPRRISGFAPSYPEAARRARIQGVVVLEVTITKQGQVCDVIVKRGLPLGLTESAVEAVKGWRYEPILLRGEPVNLRYEITLRFRLRRCGTRFSLILGLNGLISWL